MPKSRNPKIEFDQLQMYFGEDYVIDLDGVKGKVIITQPTIGNIVALGEKKFYSTLSIFVTNTTSYRLMLWEIGIDWNEFSDFQLFMMLYQGINQDASDLIFKDLDWSLFKPFVKKINGEEYPVLYDETNDIEINEDVYQHISQYLQNVFNIHPEEKFTKDKLMKEWFIEADKRKKINDETMAKKGKLKEETSIKSVISACINHPGFKYNLKELKEIGVCQFYDSVQRLQIYEQTTACMKGMYSGFVSAKDLKPDDYNFMKNI